MIEMIPVLSSTISSVGYDSFSKILRIRFKDGLFDYYNVPESVYTGLLSALSHEEFFEVWIRDEYVSKQIG